MGRQELEAGNGSRDETADDRARQAIAELVKAAGRRANGWAFRSYVVSDEYQREVVAMVTRWADTFPERLKNGEGLLLYGPAGTGKDHLAFAAVARAVATHGATARWFSCRDFFGSARDRMSTDETEAGLLRALSTPSIVVLSDPLPPFGDVGLTPWQADLLYRAIDSRWRRQLPTVCTVNVAGDDDGDRRLGAPTWDRLNDRSWRGLTRWKSYRQPAVNVEPKGKR